MFELLRRLFVSVALGAAVVTYVRVPEAVVRVRPEDPFDWYEQAYAPQQSLGAMGLAESVMRRERSLLPPVAFIEQHVRGRVKDVSGVEWRGFRQGLQAAAPVADPATGGDYFAADVRPVADVLAWLQAAVVGNDPAAGNTSGGKFVYLRFTDEIGLRFAGLAVVGPGDFGWNSVPVALRNPLRRYAYYLLTLAGVVYLLPPRPRRLAPDALLYPRLSIVLTDVIGVVLATFFFAMPLFIVVSRGRPAALLDFGFNGFGPVTLVFWLMAAISASLLVVAATQAVRQVVLLPDGLRDRTWRRDVTLRFDEITAVQPIVIEFPRGLRLLIWIVGLLARSPLLISQVLLFGSARHPGLILQLRNGSRLRMLALPDLQRVVAACRAAGIPLVEPTAAAATVADRS